MAYKVIILYRLYMPSYFLGTFTEYPKETEKWNLFRVHFSVFYFVFIGLNECRWKTLQTFRYSPPNESGSKSLVPSST